MALYKNPFANPTNPGTPGNVATANAQPANPIPNDNNTNGKPGSGTTPNPDDLNNLNADGTLKAPAQKDDKGTQPGDFSKLWDNEAADPNAAPKPTSFLPKIDPQKLQETLGKMDFSKVIKPEHLEAIKAGGDGASAALPQILNSVGQQIMLTMFKASSGMIEAGLTTAQGRFSGEIPNHVRDMMVMNGLKSSNTMMSDPAFAPVVDGIRSQIQTKYPKLTPSEVEKMTNDYFEGMATKLTTAKNKAAEPSVEDAAKKAIKTGDPAANWESWFE